MLQKKRLGLFPALLVAVLSFGGLVGAAIVTQNSGGLIPVSLANDGEDDGDDGGDDGGDDDKNDDNGGDKKESKSEKKAKEEAKKKSERDREAAKKAAERSRGSDDSDDSDDDMVNGVKVRGDGSVDDDGDDEDGDDDMVNGVKARGDGSVDDDGDDSKEDERRGDDNGMYKDRTKTLSKLQEELAKAEEDILEKQAEGVDVTAALARLAEAKAKAGTVGGAFDINDLEAAKQLSKEVKKLAHFASHDDLHDAKEIAEDTAKVEKRISQTNGKIALLEAVGGDSSTFKSSLATYESDLAALKAAISAEGYDLAAMEASLDTLERKVKRLKSSVENAIYALGGTDSQYDDDYEDEVKDMHEHLYDVADIEDDSVGRALRGIADDHKDSAKKIGETVKSIDNRNPVLQTLLGASKSDLAELESQIAANNARADVLARAAAAIEDQDMKAVVLDQIATLKEQTNKLQVFVSGQRDRLSAFGWFFNLF